MEGPANEMTAMVLAISRTQVHPFWSSRRPSARTRETLGFTRPSRPLQPWAWVPEAPRASSIIDTLLDFKIPEMLIGEQVLT